MLKLDDTEKKVLIIVSYKNLYTPTEPFRNTPAFPQTPMATKLATNRALEGYGGIS